MYLFTVFLENYKNEYGAITPGSYDVYVSARRATFLKVARISLLLFSPVNYYFYVHLREGKLAV